MMKIWAIFLLALPCLVFGDDETTQRVSYNGYKVFRTQALNLTSAKYLRELQLEDMFDFWKEANIGQSADIMASPENIPILENLLSEHGIHYTEMIRDVEILHQRNNRDSLKFKSDAQYDWDDYYGHDQINAFIDGLDNADYIRTASIGSSVENRDMRVIQITKAGSGAPNVWVEAGIHAREWIASATATYLINWLVNGDGKDLLENLNFHILPMANPDGYEYSRDHDRYWRKNRGTNSGSSCKGVDLNRNWGFHWGESGISHNPCSDVYCGASPFSEIEVKNIKAYVEAMNPKPVLGHCMHSYSQLWLWPYGYDYNAYPENYQEIKKLAEDAADALYQVHHTYFDPINSADLYPAAGASDDWYKGGLGTRYAFTTELRDTGNYGFELPARYIIPSGEEFVAGMRVVFEKIISDNAKISQI